jgi:hypothetical protein
MQADKLGLITTFLDILVTLRWRKDPGKAT